MPDAARLILNPKPDTIGGWFMAEHNRLPDMPGKLGNRGHSAITQGGYLVAPSCVGHIEAAYHVGCAVIVTLSGVASC